MIEGELRDLHVEQRIREALLMRLGVPPGLSLQDIDADAAHEMLATHEAIQDRMQEDAAAAQFFQSALRRQ